MTDKLKYIEVDSQLTNKRVVRLRVHDKESMQFEQKSHYYSKLVIWIDGQIREKGETDKIRKRA